MESNKMDKFFKTHLTNKDFSPGDDEWMAMQHLLRADTALLARKKKRKYLLLILIFAAVSVAGIYFNDGRKLENSQDSSLNSNYPIFNNSIPNKLEWKEVKESPVLKNSLDAKISTQTPPNQTEFKSIPAEGPEAQRTTIIKKEQEKMILSNKEVDQYQPSPKELAQMLDSAPEETREFTTLQPIPHQQIELYSLIQNDWQILKYQSSTNYIKKQKPLMTFEFYTGQRAQDSFRQLGLYGMLSLWRNNKWNVFTGLGYEFSHYNNQFLRSEEFPVFGFGISQETIALHLTQTHHVSLPLRLSYQIDQQQTIQGSIMMGYMISARAYATQSNDTQKESFWLVPDYFQLIQWSTQVQYVRWIGNFGIGAGLRWQSSPIELGNTDLNKMTTPLFFDITMIKRF